MADYSVVGKRLREARTRAGLSQKQLGIRAGVDEFSASPRINQYERGKYTPAFPMVERLAKVLKIPAAFFYARDDDLANVVLLFAALPPKKRKQIFKFLSSLADNRHL
jgi:transcriptional regulator with XRE-family HTH domain